MDSIPQPEGVLHIASEPGSGATSLALQLIRHSLEESGRIVWIGREMPNPDRLSDIFGNIPPTALSRFHAGAFGEHISRGIEQSLDLIEGLESITYVVIDDWAGVSGKVSSELIQMMKNLIQSCDNKCTLIATSSMYADATGKDEWKIRGPDLFQQIWRLRRRQNNSVNRILEMDNQEIELIPTDSGFAIHSS